LQLCINFALLPRYLPRISENLKRSLDSEHISFSEVFTARYYTIMHALVSMYQCIYPLYQSADDIWSA